MPIAQYQDPRKGVNILRNFATPKKITQPQAWLREVKKVIDIPEGYYIDKFDATLQTIVITLLNHEGERAYVAIKRSANLLGN